MAWIERVDRRTAKGKVWQDNLDPTKFCVDTGLATLHYGPSLNEVNMTPQAVNNAALDGWLVTENDWHYALGKPKTGMFTGVDGVVGFGGLRGAHWFKFRLLRLGYLHWPTLAWQDVGGAPNYNRANLTRTTGTIALTGGASINAETKATWAKVWNTPGGGQLDVSWRADGGRLKEEITINQVGRTWIAANRPPTTPANETYFGFVFQLDWSDIPKIVRDGVVKNAGDDFTGDVPVELRTAADELLAFMPLDECYVEDKVNKTRTALPLSKRFYKSADNYYLLVGLRCDQIIGLPAGNLVFDPTIDAQVGATEYDGGEYSNTNVWYPNGTDSDGIYIGFNTHDGGFVFRDLAIPAGSTIDVGYIQLYRNYSSSSTNVPVIYYGFDEDDTPAFAADGSDRPELRTRTTASASQNLPQTGDWVTSSELKTIIQEIVDRAGWASGNNVGFAVNGNGTSTANQYADYYYSTTNAAKVHIEYTEGGGISGAAAITLADATLASAGTVAVAGAAAITLGDATLSSAGTVSVTAAAAITLGDATLVSAWTVAVKGTAGITLGDATLASAGTVTDGAEMVTGEAAITLGGVTLLAAGTVPLSTGAVYPTAAATAAEDPWLDNDWTTPTNIYSDNAATANITASSFDSPDQSYVLKAYTFDFSAIPAGATINGVICRVNAWYRSGQGSGSMDLLQLLNTSLAKVGTNQCATPTALTTTDTTVITKGGNADLWGNALTAAWVKNANFGVALGIAATAANADVDVDYLTLEVWYTPLPTIYGAASITLGDTGLASAGTVADASIIGTASITLDGATLSSAGTVAVKGTGSITLGDATLVSVGTVAVKAAAGITLGDATLVSAGTVAVVGAAGITLGDAGLASAGAVAVTGAASVTLGDAALVSAGVVGNAPIIGTAGITLADVGLSSAGTVAVTGSASVTLADASLSSAGTVAVKGTASITLGDITLASAGVVGNVPISGTAAITLADATLVSTGTVAIRAAASVSLADVGLSSVGGVAIKGTASISLGDVTLSAAQLAPGWTVAGAVVVVTGTLGVGAVDAEWQIG